LVQSPQVADRRRAVNALIRLNSTRTLPQLANLAADDDIETRKLAQKAIMPFGEASAVGLVSVLKKPKILPLARAEIGDLLAELGDPRPGVGLRPDGLPDIAWCEVPAGEFIMGAGESDNPIRMVTLPAFSIAKYPVTYAQFQAFIDAPDGYRDSQWWVGLHEDGLKQQKGGPDKQEWPIANRPRENVSWYDALAFCRWLSAKLGYAITLPTEEQWERAARGVDGREYPYPGNFDPVKGNTSETRIGQTSAVGIFLEGASPYGVLDMSGNVWEWTVTEYLNNFRNDTSNNKRRVVRGGSWNFSDVDARAAFRDKLNPISRDYYYGFRGCCDTVPIT